MPDRPKDSSTKTGKFPAVGDEPRLEHEPKRPSSLPEISEAGSTTGIMSVYREANDESAKRDEDQPA